MYTKTSSLIACGFLFMLLSIGLKAQTALGPGDIAFTGVHVAPEDEFSFITLTDISASTAIRFTDNGWMASGEFRTGEGILEATFTTDVPCGSEVYAFAGPGLKSMKIGDTEVGTISVIDIATSNFGLSDAGDQILAYQGTEADPVFITAIDFNFPLGWADDASNNDSALPAGLTDGETAVGLSEADNSAYVCVPASGTKAEMKIALNDPDNWVTSNNPDDINVPTGCSFDITDCAAASPPMALCKDITVELNEEGSYSLSPGEVDNGSSAGAGITEMTVSPNEFFCADIGPNEVELTVIDEDGATSTCTAVVTVTGDPSGTGGGYTILALKSIHLHGDQTVLNGGVGVFKWGMVLAHKNTQITAPTTFVQSKRIHLSGASEIANLNDDYADVDLPDFEYKDFKFHWRRKNVTIKKNSTETLDGDKYRNVKVKKGATVIFTQKDVFLEDLDVDEGATVKFSGCSFVRISKRLHLGENAQVNPDGHQVKFYVKKGVQVKEGVSVWAGIDVRYGSLEVNGKKDNPVNMTGHFLAKYVNSRNTVNWDWYSGCESECIPDSPSPSPWWHHKFDDYVSTDAPAEQAAEKAVRLYPNPARNEVFVNLRDYQQQDLTIFIHNQLGLQVRRIDVEELQEEKLYIDLSSQPLPNGIYILSVKTPEGIQTRQFVITH